MPGPFLPDPTPDWLKAQNASVTDSSLTKALRMIGHLIGADNPTTQVIGLMATDLPGAPPTGGLAKAVGDLWERAKSITAYHGSPHDFEKFSLSKIGTGEGAQAYGHGLYFAENPETARTYRDTLSGRIPGGYSKPEDALVHASADFRKHGYTMEQAIPELKKAYPWAADQHLADAWHASNPGRMYEVAIHADPEDFLDWDKPLSQQSEKVKAAIKSTEVYKDRLAGYKAGRLRNPDDSTGSMWHSFLRDEPTVEPYVPPSQTYGSDVPAANRSVTELVRSKGIPGIKYLDQGSRAAGEGSRNYVVFDDKLIDILKKYGIVLPAAGAASQMAPDSSTP